MNPLKLLDGWKTEIGLVGIAAALIAFKFDALTPEQLQWILGALGTWTGIAIKHAIKKSSNGK